MFFVFLSDLSGLGPRCFEQKEKRRYPGACPESRVSGKEGAGPRDDGGITFFKGAMVWRVLMGRVKGTICREAGDEVP